MICQGYWFGETSFFFINSRFNFNRWISFMQLRLINGKQCENFMHFGKHYDSMLLTLRVELIGNQQIQLIFPTLMSFIIELVSTLARRLLLLKQKYLRVTNTLPGGDYQQVDRSKACYFDAPQIFCCDNRLGLGIDNVEHNYPLFGIPTLRIGT